MNHYDVTLKCTVRRKKTTKSEREKKTSKKIKSLIGNVSTITICDDIKSILKIYSLRESKRFVIFFVLVHGTFHMKTIFLTGRLFECIEIE